MADLTDDELEALIRAYATPPATLTGVEQPEPAPELAPVPPSMPQAWQGLPDRPTQEMVARPLMPQSAQEAEEQVAANQRLATAYSTALNAAAAIPVGRALEAGVGLARGVGGLLARSPVARGVATAGAGAAGLTAASGQTQQEDPVTAHMARIAAAEREQATLRTEARTLQQRLDDFRKRFGEVNSTSPQARILELQQFLASPEGGSVYGKNERGQTVRPDGLWRGGTQAAVEAFQQQLRADIKTRTDQLGTLDRRLTDLNGELRSLQSSARYAAAEANVPLWRRIVRDWAEPIGGAIGFLTGAGGRVWRSAGVNRADQARIAAANALINPRGSVNARVSDINEFFSRGGGVQPFRISPRAQHGFTPSPGQTTGADLFPPPGNAWWTSGDTLRVGVGAASAATLEGGRYVARQELDAARAAFREDPSEVNAGRLMRAELTYGGLSAAARGAESGLVGYGIATSIPRLGYRFGRPDTNRAGAEVLALNRLLRGGGTNAGASGSSLRYPAGTRGPNGEPLGGRFRPKT